MTCHICGGGLEPQSSDMPFRVDENRIVILKGLPVLQCNQCGEYLLEDQVMDRVEQVLSRIDPSSELEIVRYAA